MNKSLAWTRFSRLVVGGLLAMVLWMPGDALGQRSRTAADVERDIAEYSRLLAIQQEEYKRLEKQRDAGIAAYTGSSISYPGAPSGWDDFSICVDVNNHPGSAIVHYQHEMEIAKLAVDEGERVLRELRKELERKRSPVPPYPGTRTPVATTPPATAAPPTATVAPPGTTPPTAPPTTTGTAPPKKDMNCLCRCSCSAAGFNVNNVRSYYSTSPVSHMNPNGAISESCMNPSEGPCVCQGFVCRRASLVSTGACADACAR
jgi:hypothetical protein